MQSKIDIVNEQLRQHQNTQRQLEDEINDLHTRVWDAEP